MKLKLYQLVLNLLACNILVAAQPVLSAPQDGGRSVKLIQRYELPSFSLLDFGYSADELAAAQANGLTSIDNPAIGSGLQRLAGNHFLSVTDRGPNADRADGNKAFPMPLFTPTIVLFQGINNQIVPEGVLPIVNDRGEGVTGIPNGPADDSTPFLTLTATNALPFNPDGMDIEDIHTLPGGGFILVEEYGPSVVIVSPAGNVLKRYIPAGKSLVGANYNVSASLPAIFRQRRANRGFEALAVSDDGRTAYTMTQSPMGSTSAGNPTATPPVPPSPYRNSRVIRIIRMDISDPLNIQVTGQFILQMLPASEYPVGNAQRDLKISGAAWVSEDKLLVTMGGDLAPLKVVLADLTVATDVKDFPAATALPLVFENVNTDFAALGIVPATTRVVLDLGLDFPEITDAKLEGLCILNANQIAISNDNDFGIGAVPNATTKVYTFQLAEPLR